MGGGAGDGTAQGELGSPPPEVHVRRSGAKDAAEELRKHKFHAVIAPSGSVKRVLYSPEAKKDLKQYDPQIMQSVSLGT